MLNTMVTDREFGFCIDDAVIFKVEISVCGELEPTSAFIMDWSLSTPSLQSQSLQNCMKTLFAESLATDLEIVLPGDEYSSSRNNSSTSNLSNCIFSPPRRHYQEEAARKLDLSTHGRVDPTNTASFADNMIRIPCHRCILMARSPVFKAMLSHDMVETRRGEIIIPDSSQQCVRELLHFLYTGELSESPQTILSELAEPLLAVALKYHVVGLIQLCEAFLAAQITEETAADVLLLADELEAIQLKEKALQYIGMMKIYSLSLPLSLSLLLSRIFSLSLYLSVSLYLYLHIFHSLVLPLNVALPQACIVRW